MSIADVLTRHRPTSNAVEPALHRWTRDEYYRISEAGIFDNQRVELIDGEIVELAPQKDQHAACVRLVQAALSNAFGPGFTVQTQLPLDLGKDSQPEPDVCVLAGPPREHLRHPTTALVVIEVADTSLRYDRDVKSVIYAAANLPEYWIFNLVDRRVEVFRAPSSDTKPRYTQTTTLTPTDSISPLAAPHVAIAVADLLP